ncbi:MAG TPA: MFS transporter [Thermomicrobiales bacterium]|nr:MFS transporter [Thermomicrobiales bacterium]
MPKPAIQGFAALRSYNYRLFWFGQLISVTGTWIQRVAQSWLVVDLLAASAFQLGLVNVLQMAPILVFGLFAGVVIDRVPKRNLLVVTQSVQAGLAGILAFLVLTDSVVLWHVYVLAGLLGVANAFDMPTRQAFVSELVDRDIVMNAVALNSALFNTGRVLGPAIAGVLLAAFGPGICFAINAASFAAVIVGLLMMQITRRPALAKGSNFARLREGLSYVHDTPAILLPLALVAVVATFGMNFNVWIPLLARDAFATGAQGFGFLMTAMGIGSLAGALTLAFRGRTPRRHLMLGGAMLLGTLEICLAVAGEFQTPVVLGALVLGGTGFFMTTTTALANTTVQTTAPDELRGRVMSVYMTVFAGTAPFGSLIAGAVADRFSTVVSIALGGIVTLAAAVIFAAIGLPAVRQRLSPGGRMAAAGIGAAPRGPSAAVPPPPMNLQEHADD